MDENEVLAAEKPPSDDNAKKEDGEDSSSGEEGGVVTFSPDQIQELQKALNSIYNEHA